MKNIFKTFRQAADDTARSVSKSMQDLKYRNSTASKLLRGVSNSFDSALEYMTNPTKLNKYSEHDHMVVSRRAIERLQAHLGLEISQSTHIGLSKASDAIDLE